MSPFSTDFSFFDNPENARSDYDRITQGIPDSHLAFIGRLFSEISRNPSPDEILNRFERLTRSTVNKSSFYKMLCDFPPIIARLIRLLSCSHFLSTTLIRDFQYTYFLISPDLYCPPMDENMLQKNLQVISENPSYSISRKMDALRTVKRREILKIGIRDYLLDEPFEATGLAISILADACIQTLSALHYRAFVEKFGPPSTPFTIIALGKLGGNELNYSSDVDLIFVYRDEEVINKDDKEISHHEFFNQLCAAIISSVARDSREGMLYRVDTRLRPDGDAGPLARSISSYLHYYESRGQLWERQMLIKARPIAGDMDFGKQFLERLVPFIYPKTFFESPLNEIARMKWRMEEQRIESGRLNIKISSGGIRDIEFVVQALQLINGGRCLSIRTGTTLTAIQKLFESGFLNANEKETLTNAYIFYRKIEHLLQIEENIQTHSLTGTDRESKKIAMVLDFKSPEDFHASLSRHLEKVRIIFDAVFQQAPELTDAGNVFPLLSAETLNVKIEGTFHALGFASAETARRAVRALAFGHFPKMYSNVTQKNFSELMPALLREASATPDPDHTLMNFERLVANHPFIDGLYKTLAGRTDALHAMVYLASFSNFFTHILCEKPSTTDHLLLHYPDWQTAAAYDPRTDWDIHTNIHVFKKIQWIKLVCQEQWRSEAEIFKNLTQLADWILQTIFKLHFPRDGVAVIGLGKFGGNELGYKSDLDVIFVCRDSSDIDDAIVRAKLFLNDVAQTTPDGTLYDIDARLRPEGKQSPLVVTASRCRDYFENRAMFWERQSLIKARWVCGDEGLGKDVIQFFRKAVFEKPMTADEIRSVTAMRDRQIAEKIRTPGDAAHDIKFSRGAILDIEYPVQAMQIKYNIQLTSTLEAISALAAAGKIDQDKALTDNYLFLRRIEKYNYLAFERKSNKIPNDEKQLAFLAKFCKLQSGFHLLERLSSVKQQNESLYFTLMRAVSNGK